MNRNSATPAKRSARRRFRLWEKKRGNRQTGSAWAGKAAEVFFFAVLFLLAVFSLAEIVTLWWVAKDQSFLTSDWGIWLSMIVLGTLICSSAVGAVYTAMLTATTAERRAALAQRATKRDLLDDLRSASSQYPAIPKDTHWKISPGVNLAYRLPSSSRTGIRLVVFAAFTLVWNAAVIVLMVLELNVAGMDPGQFLASLGPRPWNNLTGIVLSGFALVGGYLIYRLVLQLTAAEAMGPTHVEVSAQPLRPEGKYRVSVSQHGHLQIRSLELRLVCEEAVSFSEGTDTRSEVRRVYDEVVCCEEEIAILPSEPFQAEYDLVTPDNAMHSLSTPHNSVAWKLEVTVLSKRWPRIHRIFPLVMHPKLLTPRSEVQG